jgi:hypothetical protein
VDVAIGDGGVVLLLKAKKAGRNMASDNDEEIKEGGGNAIRY